MNQHKKGMKQIILKEIRLLNFKGVRELTIEFQPKQTDIMGCNGSGKTTIFDAFTWLLFGKDSHDRKLFEIKTLDQDGNAIPRIPHEVSATLSIDGEDIALKRRFNEKWVKRRGQADEEFAGHEEERFYNNVPCSLKEWNEKIAAICGEQTFKMITSPSYFSSQKPDVQRAMLFRMAGTISDAEVAAGNADFADLLARLTGKSLEEYKREIQAKKRRIKIELDQLPGRIDERRRDLPTEEVDYSAIEAELKDKQASLADIEEQMTNLSRRVADAARERLQKMDGLNRLQCQLKALEYDIEQKETEAYNNAVAKVKQRKGELDGLKSKISLSESNLKSLNDELDRLSAKREALRAEWKSINAETLTFSENDFNCPTCGRPLEVADIEFKQAQMTERFNNSKVERIGENVRLGKANTARMQDIQAQMEVERTNLDALKAAIVDLETAIESADKALPMPPDIKVLIAQNPERAALLNKISDEEASIGEPNGQIALDESHLAEGKEILLEAIDSLKATLSVRDTTRKNQERIEQLEKQARSLSSELAALEGIEFTMAEFARAKVAAVESKINSIFSLVKFKMYEQQINGGEVETCEATVDGVPYSSLNNAGQINAGIDIINTICRYDGVCAPIFVDNAEAVNTLTPTDSQLVRLVVTEDRTLVIQ